MPSLYAVMEEEKNDLRREREKRDKQLKTDINRVLFALAFAEFNDWKLGKWEIESIERLQEFTGEKVLDMDKIKKDFEKE